MNILLVDKITNGQAILSKAQTEHLQTVLCAKVSDVVKVGFIGGKIGTACVKTLGDEKTQASLTDITLTKPPPKKLPVTVVLALPRPKVLRRLIMDMSAIGVPHIVLMNSYRTEKSYWQSPLLARLDEFVFEGLQQGCDTIRPSITLEKRFKPFVEDRLSGLGGDIWVAHPALEADSLSERRLPDVVMIGAEGGFIDYEIKLLSQNGVKVFCLSDRILRTEAAVNVILGRYLTLPK